MNRFWDFEYFVVIALILCASVVGSLLVALLD